MLGGRYPPRFTLCFASDEGSSLHSLASIYILLNNISMIALTGMI